MDTSIIREKYSNKIALNATEAADMVSISKSLMYQWMKREDCDFAVMIGGRRLIIKEKLEKWLERQVEQGA